MRYWHPFEMENDIVYSTGSNFTSGWSFQYHTKNDAGWAESRSPGFIQWVGLHFPCLKEDSIPESLSNLDKTHTDVSFGALTIDILF